MAASEDRINAATDRLERLMEEADARMRAAINQVFQEARLGLALGTITKLVASATEGSIDATLSGDISMASLSREMTDVILAEMMPLMDRSFDSGAIDAIIHMPEAAELYTLDPKTAVPARVLNPLAEAHLASAEVEIKGASQGVMKKVQASLVDGFAKGEGIPQLADRVMRAGVNSLPGATSIARTQVVQASNAGAMAQARLFAPYGQVTKEWLNTSDRRTRFTHVKAGGQEVGLDEKFVVGGWHLDFPGDPTGPPAEVRNCRCTVLFEEVPITDALPPREPTVVGRRVSDLPEERVEGLTLEERQQWVLDNLDEFVNTHFPHGNHRLITNAGGDLGDFVQSDLDVEDWLRSKNMTFFGEAPSTDQIVNLANARMSIRATIAQDNIHPEIRTRFAALSKAKPFAEFENRGDLAGFERWLGYHLAEADDLSVDHFRAATHYYGFRIDDDELVDLWSKQLAWARGHSTDLEIHGPADFAQGYRQFTTFKEQDDWYDEFFGADWEQGKKSAVKKWLTSQQGDNDLMVNAYKRGMTEDEYDQIVAAIRSSPGGDQVKMGSFKDVVSMANRMDKVMDAPDSVLPEDIVLWRGLSRGLDEGADNSLFDAIDAYVAKHGDLVGFEFADKGFGSTSLDPHVMSMFSSGQTSTGQFGERSTAQIGKPNVVLRILTPKGTRAAPVWRQSTTWSMEREVLLDACTTYRVVSHDIMGLRERAAHRITVELTQGNCPP